ncbi:MAG TPA: glycine cleavage system aminomethyltransferase GcvT [Blastocatellia bacterium]|nr:glycine cleavage system aminomethyltransferase GcvT [Blastocatellia bacterium]
MSYTTKRTSLNEAHRNLGAKMVDFAGWDMPVQYEGPIPEHMAVRTAAGIFDVSHMGEITVTGHDALALIQKLTSNDASKLADGQAQYTGLLYPEATFVDDILVHRFNDTDYFLCVNAANTDKDFDYIRSNTNGMDVDVQNVSSQYAQIAVQGPKAKDILQQLTDTPLADIKYYWFARGNVLGVPSIIAHTGYTGEDGFEVYCPPEEAPKIWNALLETGREEGIKPAGLAARNTLRLEAKMALYGNDIDNTTTVLEADLGWICKINKGEFMGRDVLANQKEHGTARKLIGFEVLDRAPVRDHYPIVMGGKEIGVVTSGSPAPYLKKNIGMAYLPTESSSVGTEFSVVVRGREVPAKVVQTPFYKRAK